MKKFTGNIAFVFKKNHIVLLSFAIPVSILMIGYAFRMIFPFGNRSLLLIDLYHQYAPFLAELRNKLLSFSSLLYTWNGGLGTSFLPLYAYYLASPLNVITVLFPKEFLTETVLALVLLKTGLSGAFFAVYLKNTYRENKIQIVAFSVMYALSAYLLAYSWNIMWLDCVYMLPLVILGLVRLCRGEKGFLYCITLAVMIFSNFYIAFAGCIFIALYYPICLFQYNDLKKPVKLLSVTGKFIGFTALAAGLVAFLIIPTWFALKLTSATGDRFPSSFQEYHRIFDYIVMHFTFAKPTVRDGMPNIYSGIIVLILLPMYFMARNIKHKVKALNAVLLIFLITSFNVNILNFIWHGLHFPNQLPFRNSYVYIFLVLSIAYPGYRSLREFSGKQTGLICAAVMFLVVLYQKLSDPGMNIFIFYGSMVFIIIYAGVLTLHKRPGFTSSVAALAFLVVVILEISAHTFVAIDDIDKTESYAGRNGYAAGVQVDEIRNALDMISAEDDSFYRTEIFPPRTTNDPFLYGFKGISVFASTYQESTVRSIENFGFHSNSINSFKYEGSTIVTDSLFGVKYFLKRSDETDDRLRNVIFRNDQLTVYENPYAISLGFYAPPEMDGWRSSSSNPFVILDSIMRNISGTGNIFSSMKLEKGETVNLTFETFSSSYIRYKRPSVKSDSTAKIKIVNDDDQQLYFYIGTSPNRAERGFVTINDKRVDFNPRRSTVVDLGYCTAGSKIEINLIFSPDSQESGSIEIRAYSLDLERFERSMETVKLNSFRVDEYSSTSVKGHINAPGKGSVVLTIPYDKGWSVKVDGEKVTTLDFDNALLSFEISQGYHTIEMRYTTDKLPYSLMVSVFSMLVLVYLYVLSERKKRADL